MSWLIKRQRVQMGLSAVQGDNDREFAPRCGYFVAPSEKALYGNFFRLVALLAVKMHVPVGRTATKTVHNDILAKQAKHFARDRRVKSK